MAEVGLRAESEDGSADVGSGVGETKSIGGSIRICCGDEGGTVLGSSDSTRSLYSSIARSLPNQPLYCSRLIHVERRALHTKASSTLPPFSSPPFPKQSLLPSLPPLS
jgi:hypothetical protein